MEGSRSVSKPERGQSAPVLLTVDEAAAVLRCSPATIYRHASSGALETIRAGGVIRVPSEAILPAPQPTTAEKP